LSTRGPKKPPPDTVGNVLGRISALKSSVRRGASVAARERGDYEQAFARGMRKAEPDLSKLRRRLERCRKSQKKTAKAPPPDSRRRRGDAAKKAETGVVDSESSEDLLDTLDSL
jgi:hypothetical protein